jgi:hypothetical protein
MAERKQHIKVPYEEGAAPSQRFESLLRKFVSAPTEKVERVLKNEKKLRKKKRDN